MTPAHLTDQALQFRVRKQCLRASLVLKFNLLLAPCPVLRQEFGAYAYKKREG